MVTLTLPKLLKQNYKKYGDMNVAMRVKEFGIWQTYTWKDYYEKVKYFSLGLISLGLEREDKVSILGDNRPEWCWVELAAQSAGGVVVGIPTDCMPNEVRYYVEHSDSKFVIARDQEQVDKLLQIKDELPLLKKVIYWDPKGVWNYDDPILMSFNEVIALGKECEKLHPGLFEENIELGSDGDIAIFCYTAGTTGLPKAAMLRHRDLIQACQSWWNVDRWLDNGQCVSFLPLAWITEQELSVVASLISGMTINFPAEPETVQENIREIGPQVLFLGPRNWESINRLVQAKIIGTTILKRFLHYLFLPVGYKVAALRIAGRKPNLFWRVLYLWADWLAFRGLKDKIGLSRIRIAYTAMAPINPDVIRFFRAIGVNIKQLYGSSEQGLVTLAHDDDVRPETLGPVMPGGEIRLSDEGEIIVRGSSLFSGYYKSSEDIEEKLKNGWYYSGDYGYITEDGHLVVIDRMSELREFSGGRKLSTQYVETRLRFSPYIKDIFVVGRRDKDYVAAIVNIDMDNAAHWAEARRIAYTGFADLSQRQEVIELIRKEIQVLNMSLPGWARVHKFANLHREFDPDEAELTRTRKVRRTFVEKRYKELIDALYGETTELAVEAPITYRDGRKETMETVIKINTVA